MPRLNSRSHEELQAAKAYLEAVANRHNVSHEKKCDCCGRVSESKFDDFKLRNRILSCITSIDAAIRQYEVR